MEFEAPRSTSPQQSPRAISPNSAQRHPRKQKYVPPTLKATINASLAMSAFGMGSPKQSPGPGLDMSLILMEPEPESEPEEEEDPELAEWLAAGSQGGTPLPRHSVQEAVKGVQEGATLQMFQMTGRKKHDRVFWIRKDPRDQGNVQVCWGKKKGKKFKSETLLEILPDPDVKTTAGLFAEVDTDNSGQIDSAEFAVLYATARGEKLPKKQLNAALKSMDSDSSGQISFAEFEKWWRDNGGDLEKLRPRAFTIRCGSAGQDVVTLILVAPPLPWVSTRGAWLAGCRQLLATNGSVQPPAATTKPPRVPAAEQPYVQLTPVAPAAEETNLKATQPLEQPADADENHRAEDVDAMLQPQDDAPWYDETQPMWQMWVEEDGSEVFEDIVTQERLDLSLHDPPEKFWVWDDDENAYLNMDEESQVYMMDADLNPYYVEASIDANNE
jgi:hypothetical protein